MFSRAIAGEIEVSYIVVHHISDQTSHIGHHTSVIIHHTSYIIHHTSDVRFSRRGSQIRKMEWRRKTSTSPKTYRSRRVERRFARRTKGKSFMVVGFWVNRTSSE